MAKTNRRIANPVVMEGTYAKIREGLTEDARKKAEDAFDKLGPFEGLKGYVEGKTQDGISELCEKDEGVSKAYGDYNNRVKRLNTALINHFGDPLVPGDEGLVGAEGDLIDLNVASIDASFDYAKVEDFDANGDLTGACELQRAIDYVTLIQGLHDVNPTDDSVKVLERAKAAQLAIDGPDGSRNVLRAAAKAASDAFTAAGGMPALDQATKDVEESENTIACGYTRVENKWKVYVDEEAECQEKDCDAPTVNQLLIKRGEVIPTAGQLDFGQMGWTETDRNDGTEADPTLVKEKHLWIGEKDGSNRLLFAFGDAHTVGSMAELDLDLSTDIAVNRDELDTEIAKIHSNFATLNTDSIAELVRDITALGNTGSGLYSHAMSSIADLAEAVAHQQTVQDKALKRLKEQHDVEIRCMQKGLLVIDGGTFPSPVVDKA